MTQIAYVGPETRAFGGVADKNTKYQIPEASLDAEGKKLPRVLTWQKRVEKENEFGEVVTAWEHIGQDAPEQFTGALLGVHDPRYKNPLTAPKLYVVHTPVATAPAAKTGKTAPAEG